MKGQTSIDSQERRPLLQPVPTSSHSRRQTYSESPESNITSPLSAQNEASPAGEYEADSNDHATVYATRKLWIASGLCLIFFVVEIIGGIISNSLAILTDSFHLLSDLSGFLISLFAIYIARRKATKRHSFGFHRAEILGALISVLLIWVVTAFLIKEAIERIKNPQPINSIVMLVVASIGLVVNLILVFALGHGHSHEGHDHHHHNINLKAAIVHIIGDIVSSIGVLISSIILTFKPTWLIVDPICTFVFSIIVMFTTFQLIRDSINVLMECTPTHIDPHHVESDLLQIASIVAVHDLHIWVLTVGKVALAVHVEVVQGLSIDEYARVLNAAQELLCDKYNVHHTTIQLETAALDAFAAHCKSALCNGGTCSRSIKP